MRAPLWQAPYNGDNCHCTAAFPQREGSLMKRLVFVLVLLLAAPANPASAADKRPMKVDDLFRFKRVSDPQISPDGKLVVYVVGAVNLENNSIASCLWLAPTDG